MADSIATMHRAGRAVGAMLGGGLWRCFRVAE